MNCSIDRIRDLSEEVWIVDIKSKDAPEMLALLLGISFNKINYFVLQDKAKKTSIQIEGNENTKNQEQVIVNLAGRRYCASKAWIDAITAILLDVILFGWNETAHLDYEFASSAGNVSVCFSISLSEP